MFNDTELRNACLAGGNTITVSTGEPNTNLTVKILTKHMACFKFHISFFLSVLNSSIPNIQFPKNQTHYTYMWRPYGPGPVRTQKIFMRGGFIQRHMVVIYIWCALFVTLQFDVIFMCPNQRFREIC